MGCGREWGRRGFPFHLQLQGGVFPLGSGETGQQKQPLSSSGDSLRFKALRVGASIKRDVRRSWLACWARVSQ